MFNIDYELNEKIHATIINPYLTWDELNANCDLIQKYNIRNVSTCLLYTSPSPRDVEESRMPSSA